MGLTVLSVISCNWTKVHSIVAVGEVDKVVDLRASGVGIIGTSAVAVMRSNFVVGLVTANCVVASESSLGAVVGPVVGVSSMVYAVITADVGVYSFGSDIHE